MGRHILCRWPAATGPEPFDPRKPRMGRHRSRRLFDIVALYRPVKPSDSRKFRSPINNQGVQITNQNEDLRSSAKSAVKNLSFSCLSVSKPRMTPIPADSNSYNLSELNTIQGGVASPYSQSATLDTKPLAKSYLGGSRSELSSNHFQYARARICSSFIFVHSAKSSLSNQTRLFYTVEQSNFSASNRVTTILGNKLDLSAPILQVNLLFKQASW